MIPLRIAVIAACLCCLHDHVAGQRSSPWTTLPSPNPSPFVNRLYGVGGTGREDVWAVGAYVPSMGTRSFAMHWDGAQWTHVPTPSPFGGDLIKDVEALAPNDVWAVGGTWLPYAFHFDGATWSASLLPQPGQFPDSIVVSDLVALAPDDVWAVGWYDLTGTAQLRTAVWHWDGATWSVVRSPSVPNLTGGAYPSMLLSISAAAPDAIFAVGEWRIGNTWFPLVLRYDGVSWQRQAAPVSNFGDGRLRAVSARTANDVWAVGTANDHSVVIGGGYAEPFALHFDGHAWSVVPTPQPSPWNASALRSVLAVGRQVFAVGTRENATQGLDTLILDLDPLSEGAFSVVPSTDIPGDGQGWNELFDLARFADELWAIGHGTPAFHAGGGELTLIERSFLRWHAAKK